MTKLISPIFMLTLSLLCISGIELTTFTITNKCNYTIWPGISKPLSNTTGFVLKTGESRNLTAPSKWDGQIWGRTNCSDYRNNGIYYCVTGNCHISKIECMGTPATPPATLIEFALNGYNGLDFFDVSLLKGYNLPLSVIPKSRIGQNCTTITCEAGINEICPRELKVMSEDGSEVVGCKSPCAALELPQYCCTGKYASEDSCKPSTYSQVFKYACPQAYSYTFDYKITTFTCASADYEITFCPSSNSSASTKSLPNEPGQPASSPQTRTSPSPLRNGTTGKGDKSDALLLANVNLLRLQAVAFVVSIIVAFLLFL